jgi:poly-gamma-glutamate capsule biosynthesis protein CapA/YwtB (metallophosphatase superfamily)
VTSKKPVTKLKKDRGETILVAVGDVVISRTTPGEAFARVLDELKAGAFSCCNFEVPLSNKGMPQYGKFETLHAAPEMIEGFVHGGFRVVSLANNHSMDYGPEALLDTIALIDSCGILHAGAGRNLEEARRPVFFEAGGMRFAFVSFATEAFPGYGAHSQKPGIAVIRRDPLYGPSCVNPDDVQMMKEVIRGAKKEADLVVAAFHWGLSQSRSLTRSQLTLGRAAVDAGAKLVVGHHPHVLQAAEVYKRSLILYSLGNFVFDLTPEFLAPTTRDTVLVKVKLSGKALKEAIFMPAWINEGGQPEILEEKDDKNREIISLFRDLSAARKTKLDIKNGIGTVRV